MSQVNMGWMVLCTEMCVCACVCVAVERQRVSVCVKVKYRWRRPECVRVSEVQCNCRQSQPYLPVKNTIIPHSPSQAISPVSSSLTLFLSPSLSLYLQLQPRGLFLSRTKTFPTSPPSPSLSLSPSFLLFSLSAILFLCWELESGNEEAVHTHTTYCSGCCCCVFIYFLNCGEVKSVAYEAKEVGYPARWNEIKMHHRLNSSSISVLSASWHSKTAAAVT